MDQFQNLPPEYAAQLQALQRKKQFAELLSQRAFAPQQTEMVSGRAVKRSPLSQIAQALTGVVSQSGAANADSEMARVMQGYQQKADSELAAAQNLPEMEAIKRLRVSRDPRAQKLAETMYKALQDRAMKRADVLKDNDTEAALKAVDGTLPQDYKLPKLGDPVFGQFGDNPYALVPEKNGGRKFAWAPKGQTISFDQRQAGREQEMALDSLKGDLKGRQERALAARETLSSNQIALEALNAGAQSGGLEGFKQAVRKVAQGFNLNAPETASTEELSMALGNAVLNKARALAPVTGEDVKRLQEILGSVNTDPTALMKMLAVYNGIAAKELQDFGKYISYQEQNIKDPTARSIFSGQQIGLEMRPPPGNTTQGMRAIGELASRGGDPSAFAIGGEQIPADARFDIRGSGVPPQKKGPASPPSTETPGLTAAEAEELKRLRAKHGRSN